MYEMGLKGQIVEVLVELWISVDCSFWSLPGVHVVLGQTFYRSPCFVFMFSTCRPSLKTDLY